MTIKGIIERITYHNEETGFAVIKVKSATDLFTVTGRAVNLIIGEEVECAGEWINNPKYGRQLQAESIRTIPPSTKAGIEKYLASGLVKGIGAHFAKRLVKSFGTDVFDVIENTPERLTELEGIGPKRVQQLVSAWSEQKVVRDIIVFLHSFGLGSARAYRIYKTYGEQAVQIIQKNPYRLASDIPGIGFKIADKLAQELGIESDALIRGYAGIYHVLQNASSQGHCGLPKNELLDIAHKLLQMPPDKLDSSYQHLVSQGQIIEDLNLCCLENWHQLEIEVANHIQRLKSSPVPWGSNLKLITDIKLSQSQLNALELASNSKFMVITGGPGVGKTTLVKSILNSIVATGACVVLAAPTGRAAKRMSEATGKVAKTIHRLLEFDPQVQGFSRNQDNPLVGDLLIVDEASMIDVRLMAQLLRAIPDNMAILIVGDIDQLPSVGPGMVLSDIINSNIVSVARLTEIYRQAQTSQIITNAHKINQGIMPHSADPGSLGDFYIIAANEPELIYKNILKMLQDRIPNKFGLNSINDIQILTPMQKGPLGARYLNEILQMAQNPNLHLGVKSFNQIFAPGDKVLQTINNYDKNIFNGDLGIIERVDKENAVVIIDFEGRLINYDFTDLDELQLAYAMTIHKSQGSEFPAVIIPIAMSHFMLLERNLLYTAITRGKQLVVLIGERRAIKMATSNQTAKTRNTLLKTRLLSCKI